MNIQNLTVPHGWQINTVGNCCSICNHLREPISATVRQTMQGQYPYYGPTRPVDFLDHYRLNGKYALIGEDGDHFLKYAKWSMTQLVEGKFNVNNHAHVIQGTEKCSAEWFFFFFQHTNIFPFLTRQGSGRYKLNKATLKKLPVLLPPLPEQHKIAEILGAWDEAIRLTERLIEGKQKRKKGLMQQLLTGKVRFPGFEGEWKTGLIGDIAKVRRGASPRPIKDPKWFSENGRGWVRIADITKTRSRFLNETTQYLSPLGEGRSVRVDPGDLIMSIAATIGVPKIVNIPACIHDGFVTFSEYEDRVDQEFFYYALTFLTDKLSSRGQPGTQKNLNTKLVRKISIPLISLEEQIRIAQVLNMCEEELDFLQQKAAALRQQKKGLMQQLLTGKVRVKV